MLNECQCNVALFHLVTACGMMQLWYCLQQAEGLMNGGFVTATNLFLFIHWYWRKFKPIFVVECNYINFVLNFIYCWVLMCYKTSFLVAFACKYSTSYTTTLPTVLRGDAVGYLNFSPFFISKNTFRRQQVCDIESSSKSVWQLLWFTTGKFHLMFSTISYFKTYHFKIKPPWYKPTNCRVCV
jgi:hypothetical protein